MFAMKLLRLKLNTDAERYMLDQIKTLIHFVNILFIIISEFVCVSRKSISLNDYYSNTLFSYAVAAKCINALVINDWCSIIRREYFHFVVILNVLKKFSNKSIERICNKLDSIKWTAQIHVIDTNGHWMLWIRLCWNQKWFSHRDVWTWTHLN